MSLSPFCISLLCSNLLAMYTINTKLTMQDAPAMQISHPISSIHQTRQQLGLNASKRNGVQKLIQCKQFSPCTEAQRYRPTAVRVITGMTEHVWFQCPPSIFGFSVLQAITIDWEPHNMLTTSRRLETFSLPIDTASLSVPPLHSSNTSHTCKHPQHPKNSLTRCKRILGIRQFITLNGKEVELLYLGNADAHASCRLSSPERPVFGLHCCCHQLVLLHPVPADHSFPH